MNPVIIALLAFVLGMLFAVVIIWHLWIWATKVPTFWEGFFRGILTHPVARLELDLALMKEKQETFTGFE